jgi:hypothetical protein
MFLLYHFVNPASVQLFASPLFLYSHLHIVFFIEILFAARRFSFHPLHLLLVLVDRLRLDRFPPTPLYN